MNYIKCIHCNRSAYQGNSVMNPAPQNMVCWSCDEKEPLYADRTASINLNNNYVYGIVSFFLGTLLLYCNIYVEPYSFGWWMLTVKGAGLIILCFAILCVELFQIE
jgi:hypothetical protein